MNDMPHGNTSASGHKAETQPMVERVSPAFNAWMACCSRAHRGFGRSPSGFGKGCSTGYAGARAALQPGRADQRTPAKRLPPTALIMFTLAGEPMPSRGTWG